MSSSRADAACLGQMRAFTGEFTKRKEEMRGPAQKVASTCEDMGKQVLTYIRLSPLARIENRPVLCYIEE